MKCLSLKGLLAALVLAAAQGTANGAIITIDTFGTIQGPLLVFGPPPAPMSAFDSLTPAPGAIGNERDFMLTRTSSNTDLVIGDVGITAPGTVSLATGSTADGNILLSYDGVDGVAAIDPTGLGGINLTGPEVLFLLSATSDLPASFTITVFSGVGMSSTSGSITIPPGPGFTSFAIPTTSFTGNADFSNVGAISLLIESVTTGADILIQGPFVVVIVPEPGSLAVFGMCLLGVAGYGWRRRKLKN